MSAYFEGDELSFGILHQPSFERRLRQFFDGHDSNSADPGWYALRHTVYASAKRKILKDAGVVDFNEVHSSAFPYFANALAVHTEMIYYKSSVTAVQALAAMVRKCFEIFYVLKCFLHYHHANEKLGSLRRSDWSPQS